MLAVIYTLMLANVNPEVAVSGPPAPLSTITKSTAEPKAAQPIVDGEEDHDEDENGSSEYDEQEEERKDADSTDAYDDEGSGDDDDEAPEDDDGEGM